MLALPDELLEAVEQALATAPPARWIRAAQALSERYRAPRAEGTGSLASGRDAVLGYAAMILPATYAQLYGATAATAQRAPGWAPRTLLDLGSGPGTALWAASVIWPSIEVMHACEREPAFIALGSELGRASSHQAVRAAHWQRLDLARPWPGLPRCDLVVLGHVLNELDPVVRERTVQRAWELTRGVLLIIEPGTSAAFLVVRAARDMLLALGARTLAPCPHDLPCPLRDDWCHFPQRLVRPAFQRRARGALSTWEDSKYSYAAMARFAAEQPIWGRVIAEPASNKAYAEALISSREGVGRYRGLKRYREAFRRVKGLRWGEALAEALPEPIAPGGDFDHVTGEERP